MKDLWSVLSLAVVLVVASNLSAQEPERRPPPVPPDAPPAAPADLGEEVQRRITALEREVGRLRSELDGVRRDHERDIQDLNRLVMSNADAIRTSGEMIRANAEMIRANTEAIESNRERIGANARRIADNSSQLRAQANFIEDNSNKLNDITRQDETGRYSLDILGNMQRSESFRRDLQQASQGKLWIFNPDPVERPLYINGSRWMARVGWSYVWVPIGPVSVTRFAGVTPAIREDWQFIDRRQQLEMVYDFERPWD